LNEILRVSFTSLEKKKNPISLLLLLGLDTISNEKASTHCCKPNKCLSLRAQERNGKKDFAEICFARCFFLLFREKILNGNINLGFTYMCATKQFFYVTSLLAKVMIGGLR
jgi:hypothetical protein